ncbi:uncharacterized protein AAEQ78_007657 isoform 2-T2 [Lycaon pictus]
MITNTWSAKLDIAFPLRLTGRRHRTLPVLGTALAQCMLRPQRFKDRPPHRVIFTCSPLLLQPLNINCRKHRHSNSTKPWGAGDPFPEFSWSTASLQGTDDSAHLTTLLQIAQPSIPLSKTHWLSKPSQRTAILIFRYAFLSSQMPYLPPPKAQVKRVKGKCPSSTLRVFKAKLQTEIASKRFFQDGRTQPRVGCGDPYHRSHEKLPVEPV